MRFLKQCLQAPLPSPFHPRIPLAADPACRPLAFSIVLTDREPYSRIPLAADPACRSLAFSIVLTDREPGTGYDLCAFAGTHDFS